MESVGIAAHKLVSGRPNREFPSGRVCARQKCKTTLSRYNSGRLCSLHDQSERRVTK